jgi:hypothetical protein
LTEIKIRKSPESKPEHGKIAEQRFVGTITEQCSVGMECHEIAKLPQGAEDALIFLLFIC